MNITERRQRSKRTWDGRSPWNSIFDEAYRYVLPNRKPGGTGKAKAPSQMIYDMTGPNSYVHFAGELQRLIFPPGTVIPIETGPLIATRLSDAERKAWDMQLSNLAHLIYPFFQAGGFDNAMHEFCLDLGVSNAYILPLKGPSIEEPLKFVCIPQDEVAVEWDGWGRLALASWKREMKRHQILSSWPKGKFSPEFRKENATKPNDPFIVYQDFARLDDRWEFSVYLEKEEDLIATDTMRTQPLAVGRMTVVPGEDYARGPVLFALPTIKTQNKAQELALRSAAIQMLGLWAYRAGGTFNPDTVRLGPGEFWAMQSTGGIMGPDVQRLDQPGGRLEIARMVIANGQQQIRDALLDTRINDDGGTPASASEIAVRMRQNSNTYVGSYGRLNNDVLPVVMPRAMEILKDWRLLPELMVFNQLLATFSVPSPMAMATKADQLEAITNFMQLVEAVEALPHAGREVSKPRFYDRARKAMMVDPSIVTTEAEKEAFDKQAAEQQLAAQMGEMANRAAPQLAQGLMDGGQPA